MTIFSNYFLYNQNAIVISKSTINSIYKFPKVEKLLLFFIIDTKHYKKNLLLFCIVISLIFGVVSNTKMKETKNIQSFYFCLQDKMVFQFLTDFIYLYLPLLNTNDNYEKQGILLIDNRYISTKSLVYRLDYFSFPVIFQLDSLCSNFEMLQNFISKYKLRVDVYLRSGFLNKESNEYLLRMIRLPCVFKVKSI